MILSRTRAVQILEAYGFRTAQHWALWRLTDRINEFYKGDWKLQVLEEIPPGQKEYEVAFSDFTVEGLPLSYILRKEFNMDRNVKLQQEKAAKEKAEAEAKGIAPTVEQGSYQMLKSTAIGILNGIKHPGNPDTMTNERLAAVLNRMQNHAKFRVVDVIEKDTSSTISPEVKEAVKEGAKDIASPAKAEFSEGMRRRSAPQKEDMAEGEKGK